MQKQNSQNLLKFIITIAIIMLIGTLFGVVGYYLTGENKHSSKIEQIKQKEKTEQINKIKSIELSQYKKAVLNSETKEVIFTIDEANKGLKNQLYYNQENILTEKEKYTGNCFEEAVLSNDKRKIVFSMGCFSEDLEQSLIGVFRKEYTCDYLKRLQCNSNNTTEPALEDFNKYNEYSFFLNKGNGKNFVWSKDDKTIIYETNLGLSGMTEIRTIDSRTGEMIETKIDTSDWKTYRNEEYGFELKYPEDWASYKHEIISNMIYFDNVEPRVYSSDLSYPMKIRIYQNEEEFIKEYNYKNFEITDIKDYLEKYSNIDDPEIGNVKKFNISGIEGYNADISGMGGGTDYYISTNNHFYVVNFFVFSEYNKLVDQILSTLKFI